MNVGEVYVVFTTLARPPKDKITLCVCTAQNLFVWINTLPNRSGIGQFPLGPSDHSALSHDCFLDLSRMTTFSAAELASARGRGPISRALAARILAFVASDPPKTLPPRQLRILIENLSRFAAG